MEMSPNQVRTATFASSRKGFDPSEVASFLDSVADELEAAQNHATAMEARARAAVSKLQELSSSGGSSASAAASAPPASSADQSEVETISRTLLLAQRAADEAIAEAKAEAARLLDEAREDARKVGAEERNEVRSEVEALLARREFLQADVEHLENFLLDQRERLRTAASALVDMAERVPGGLGYLRPPLLSASDDDEVVDPMPDQLFLTDADPADADAADADAADADQAGDERAGDELAGDDQDQGEATEALPPIRVSDDVVGSGPDDVTPTGRELRFAPGIDARPDPGRGPGR